MTNQSDATTDSSTFVTMTCKVSVSAVIQASLDKQAATTTGPAAIPTRQRTLNLDMGKVEAAAAVQGQISARIKSANAADKLNNR